VVAATIRAAFSLRDRSLALTSGTPLGIEGLANVYQQLQGLLIFALIFVASAAMLVGWFAREDNASKFKWLASFARTPHTRSFENSSEFTLNFSIDSPT
jgi:hypothetical protein